MGTKQKRIFLSHASKDKALADELVDLLTVGCAVNPNDILCTSLKGKGISAGTSSFIEFLRTQIQRPDLVILLLSENYFDSYFCLCELGATWGMDLSIFPLVVPPVEKSKLKATLAVTMAGDIGSASYLDELRDSVKSKLGAEVPTATWNMKRDAFLAGQGDLLKGLAKPASVPASKMKAVEDQYQAALTEIGNKEKTIMTLRSRIADLEKCKDREQVREVIRKYSGADAEFERLCKAAKAMLEKLMPATRVALFWKLRGDWYVPEDQEDWADVRAAEAVEEVFRAREEEKCSADQEHPRVRRALDALEELKQFLRDPKDEAFAERFEERYDFPPSLGTKDFWDKFLAYV